MSSKNYTQKSIGTPLELGEGGPRVKDNAGAIEHRNAADDDFAIARGADPVGANDLVTKGVLDTISEASKEPTGFTEPENVIVTYNASAQTITLTGPVAAYWRGEVVPELISGWTSPSHSSTHPTPLQSLFLYYDGSTYQWSTSPWPFSDLQIAFVAFSSTGTYLFTLRECHGMMPWQSHKDFHENIGTWRSAGGDVTGLSNYGSTTPIDRQPIVGECEVDDEDIPTILSIHNTQNNYTRMHLDGPGGVPILTTGAADIPWLSGTIPQYNEFTGGIWTNTNLPNNDYMSLWLMAIPAGQDATGSQSQNARFIWWAGQAYSDNLAVERARNPGELNLGEFAFASTEFIFIEQVIIRRLGTNWSVTEQRKLTGNKFSLVSGGGGGVTDHGALTGLGDDDHTQYLLVNGTRAMSGNLDMGANDVVNIDKLTFKLTPPVTPVEGDVWWNEDDHTLNIQTDVAGTILQVGQEFLIYGANKSGVDIENGDLVYITGAQGQRPTFAHAQADAEATSKGTIAVATHQILDNNNGFSTHVGLIRNIPVPTSTFTDGDSLWLSATTPGGWTNVRPASPNHAVHVGYVVLAHDTAGIIFAKIQNGWETYELHDVSDTPADTTGQVLIWNETSKLYEPGSIVDLLETALLDDVTGNLMFDDVTGKLMVDV